MAGQFGEKKGGQGPCRLTDQVERHCHASFAVPVMAFLIILECSSASLAQKPAQKGFELSGKAILTVGNGMRPCREIFLISPADAASLGLDLAAGSHLRMDWEFHDRVRAARSHAKAITTCGSNGSFGFHEIPRGKIFAVARFFWLRGKWSTGGSLIGEINLPSDQPLDLRAQLAQ